VLVIVGVIALFIIINTIRLAVLARAEEIEVMRLGRAHPTRSSAGRSSSRARWSGSSVRRRRSRSWPAWRTTLSQFKADFFRVLPLQFGSLTRDVGAGDGHRRRARDRRLLAVRSHLPHPLTCRRGRRQAA
jgi:hypothetical protein